MKQFISCDRCGHVGAIQSDVNDGDLVMCPECNLKHKAENCIPCKSASSDGKPFTVYYAGVNAKFKTNVTSLNRQFELLLKSYNSVQSEIATMKGILADIATGVYNKCANDMSSAVFTANNMDVGKVYEFLESPYVTVANIIEATNSWLDTPRIIVVPSFLNISIGIPLGMSHNGSKYFLVSNFTLMQYPQPGEVISKLNLDVPLDISIGSLHVSGPDMDELEDSLIAIEQLRGESIGDGIPASSGISPMSAVSHTGSAMSGSNFRTAEVTNPELAILSLGSLGIPIKMTRSISGKLTALTEFIEESMSTRLNKHTGHGDMKRVISWMKDILDNSNCHLVGGSIHDLLLLVEYTRRFASKRINVAKKTKDMRVIYISSNAIKTRGSLGLLDSGPVISHDTKLLDQDDYDNAELIIIDGESWAAGGSMTDNVVNDIAFTNTPVCIWTENPEVDLLNVTQRDDVMMGGVLLRLISSLCPFVSSTDDSGARHIEFDTLLVPRT